MLHSRHIIAAACLAAAALCVSCGRVSAPAPGWTQVSDPAPSGAGRAHVVEGTITLPTTRVDRVSYTPPPFALDDVDRGYPFPRADRNVLESNRIPVENVTWRTVVLENEYLRVTLLPDLGGRLFEATLKPSGRQVFHRVPSLNPYELWYCGKEWMYATAGLRFEFPAWGHDPNTEMPWAFEMGEWPSGAASAVFTRTDERTGVRLTNRVSLDPGRSWIRLDFELVNTADHPEPAAVWVITGFLATRGIEFIMPTDFAIEHGGEETDHWPVVRGRDWSYFRNWERERSFFALDWRSEFSGLYDYDGGFGVVRWADPREMPGIKLWGDPGSMGQYYVSIYGGTSETMEGYLTLAPGSEKRWQELWYPIAATEGLTQANREVALSIHSDGEKLMLGRTATGMNRGARTVVTRGGKVLFDKREDLSPNAGLVDRFDASGDPAETRVTVTASDGRVLIDKTFPPAAIRPAFEKKSSANGTGPQ